MLMSRWNVDCTAGGNLQLFRSVSISFGLVHIEAAQNATRLTGHWLSTRFIFPLPRETRWLGQLVLGPRFRWLSVWDNFSNRNTSRDGSADIVRHSAGIDRSRVLSNPGTPHWMINAQTPAAGRKPLSSHFKRPFVRTVWGGGGSRPTEVAVTWPFAVKRRVPNAYSNLKRFRSASATYTWATCTIFKRVECAR